MAGAGAEGIGPGQDLLNGKWAMPWIPRAAMLRQQLGKRRTAALPSMAVAKRRIDGEPVLTARTSNGARLMRGPNARASLVCVCPFENLLISERRQPGLVSHATVLC